MQFPWQKKSFQKRRQKKVVAPNMLQKQIIVGVLIVIGLSLLLTAVYHVTRVDRWQIADISVVGGVTISGNTVEQIVTESLTGSYYRLVPKRFLYTYPQKEIVDRIKQIDRIKHVAVSVSKPQELQIVFEEHVPSALWCDAVENTECFFMDKKGYSFGVAPQLEGNAFVRYVQSAESPIKDTQGFTAEFIARNQSFIDLLESELSLFVTYVHKIGEYDLEYTVAGGGKIKTSQTQSLQTTLQNLETLLTSEDFVHLQSGDFQYIDLRFGDKVFVNEESPETKTATSSEATGE